MVHEERHDMPARDERAGMVMITAGDAVARAGGGGGGGPAEDVAVDAHVVVDVGRCATAAEVTADQSVSGCRICHLGDGELPVESGAGQLVRIGCGCRGELAAAHRRCAEAWFSVRGNRRCEICGESAANITGWAGSGSKEFMQQWHEMCMDGGGSSQECSFCRSQSFCNLLIACLVILFILPLLFHNHMI